MSRRAASRPESGRDIPYERVPGHLIRRAQQVHTALWSNLVPGDLTSTQLVVLVELAREPRLNQTELGTRVSLDRSTAADVLSRLAERGLLRRVRDPADGRRWLLELTPAGADLLDKAAAPVLEVQKQLLAPLDQAEREALIHLLTRLLDQAEPAAD